MATHRDILNNVRDQLADPKDGVNVLRWTDDSLLRHYNKALRDIAKRVSLYRRTDVAGYFNSRGILQLPPDVLDTLEVYWDGEPLAYIDRYALRDMDPGYLTATGTPRYWFRGLSDPKEVRLYPMPSPDGDFETDQMTYEDDDEYGFIASIELDGAFIDIDQEEGLLVTLDVDDEPAVLSVDETTDLGDIAFAQFNGLVKVSVSYLPAWIQVADLDEVRPDREDIEETLEYGVAYRALEKSGREEDLARAREFRARFRELVEGHSADRSSDFTEQDHQCEGNYL